MDLTLADHHEKNLFKRLTAKEDLPQQVSAFWKESSIERPFIMIVLRLNYRPDQSNPRLFPNNFLVQLNGRFGRSTSARRPSDTINANSPLSPIFPGLYYGF